MYNYHNTIPTSTIPHIGLRKLHINTTNMIDNVTKQLQNIIVHSQNDKVQYTLNDLLGPLIQGFIQKYESIIEA